MSELHETLQTLGPVEWSDVPTDSLEPYLKHLFEAGELICNSVPEPPGGTEFSQSKVSRTTPDSANSAQEIGASDARPPPPHPAHAELQSAWGKPLKLGAKENQMGISVYKMAGKDRHGAWFARRSVHEGISFTKMKRAMQREFAESLAVQGGPGEGNIRGIGGDRKLEKYKVEGQGTLEVYQLSAQFPGPTTPREFITLLATSENALTDKTSHEKDGKKHRPRHYMVVSKPVTHPDAPERNGYIRGQYESVELIREVPIHVAPESKQGGASSDHELNPVEWIMVTRSDPGGGIPRFMVDRGTPSSICADAVKFLDWACAKDEIPDADDDEDLQKVAAVSSPQHAEVNGVVAPSTSTTQKSPPQPAQQQQSGIFSHLTNALEAGIEAYAPTSVASYTQSYLHQDDDDSSDDSSDSSSFASAIEIPSEHVTPTTGLAAASTDSLSASVMSTTDTASMQGASHHDKELRKLEEQREKLDTKLAKKREAEDEKLEIAKQKETADQVKVAEKHEKEVQKIEERRQKELAKIEAKKEKELQKAEKRRQKNLDRDTLSRLSRERDEFRSQLDLCKRDNGILREQVGDLQRENVILVNQLNKFGGPEAIKAIKEDVEAGRKRSGSLNKK